MMRPRIGGDGFRAQPVGDAIELTDGRRAEVEEALRRRDVAPRVRERLEMVKAAGLGYGVGAIARWSGRTERTVVRWLGAYGSGGIEALVGRPLLGASTSADAAYLEALERAVGTSPRELGLGFDAWTSPRLSAYVEWTTGVRIASGWVRALLAARRFRRGRPERSPGHLRDPEEVARCEARLAEVGGEGEGRAG